MIKSNTKNQKGFTIIEMIVAIAIFMVVIVLGMTATLSMINANRKSQSSTLILSNLSLAIEAMTKSIRVGSGYSIGPNGAWLEFTNSSGLKVVRYTFVPQTSTTKGYITRTMDGRVAPITAPEVNIEELKFKLNSTGQPTVTMLVKGIAGTKVGTESRFYLQSLISQRLITSI